MKKRGSKPKTKPKEKIHGTKKNNKGGRDREKNQSKNHSIQQHEDAALKVARGSR